MGEEQAISYLKDQGYQIVTTNFHSRFGEIDIVALDRDTLVFIEVKDYSSRSLVSPYYAISQSKQKKIIKTAKYYLLRYPTDNPIRFDAIIIENKKIEHIEGAFKT